MKEETYKKNDGSEGVRRTLEAGDEVRVLFKEARASNVGKFPKFSLQVTKDLETPLADLKDEDKVYLELSKSQGERVNQMGLEIGDIIVGEEYENNFGTFVGVKKK